MKKICPYSLWIKIQCVCKTLKEKVFPLNQNQTSVMPESIGKTLHNFITTGITNNRVITHTE